MQHVLWILINNEKKMTLSIEDFVEKTTTTLKNKVTEVENQITETVNQKSQNLITRLCNNVRKQ